MTTALLMFLIFILITLVITYWAARRSSDASNYFAAGRRITGWQNGIAVAGDYMSAASFLGIAGIIAFQGYDGFMYSVGWLVAYLTVLLIVAEPLRNAGKYTMADVLAYRLRPRPVHWRRRTRSTMLLSGAPAFCGYLTFANCSTALRRSGGSNRRPGSGWRS